MKQLIVLMVFLTLGTSLFAQGAKTEVYDLVKKLLYDSTGYENVGDWAVGQPKKFPVAWKADRVEMSPDTSINFFRRGSATLSVNGRTYQQQGQPIKWEIMLKGPRMGYSSFSLLSSASSEISPKFTIDSLFGKRPFKATLIKSCDANPVAGFYYYEVKILKKDPAFIKLSWLSINGNTALRLDVFDSWSRYAAKTDCK